MPIQLVVIILTAGFFALSPHFTQESPSPNRTPQSLTSPTYAGTYFLSGGTDGCPAEIQWLSECQGFTLIPSASPLIAGSQKFCHVNRGTKTSSESTPQGLRKVISTVTLKENMITRAQTTVFQDRKSSLSLTSEDTLIYDETGKLLWEHNQDGRGYSCLYTK